MVVGKSSDDAGSQLVSLGMGQLQGGHLLQMVMQQPGMVDQDLQDQGLAARDSAALSLHDRTCRQLGAGRLIGARRELDRTGRPATASTKSLATESIRLSA